MKTFGFNIHGLVETEADSLRRNSITRISVLPFRAPAIPNARNDPLHRTPSALMREASVVGFMLSNSAAPPGPKTLPPLRFQRRDDALTLVEHFTACDTSLGRRAKSATRPVAQLLL